MNFITYKCFTVTFSKKNMFCINSDTYMEQGLVLHWIDYKNFCDGHINDTLDRKKMSIGDIS